jgi:NAD kinase
MVEITLKSDFQGVVSVDGRTDIPLAPGDSVEVKRSAQTARFLRMQPYNYFYATLTNRLNPDTRVDNVSGVG